MAREKIKIRLPTPHDHQRIFYSFNEDNPKVRVLVAPCGTKLGKSFGSALWLAKEALTNNGVFCVWIAPTYRKAKIGYRYIKAMLPEVDNIRCVDGKLEIRINNSYIVFLHGHDAEVTVEGEAVDRFVIDEAGKIKEQVWHSLLTTITQTLGLGIITGTPRGSTWYSKLFKMAKSGVNPSFMAVRLKTELSPYISKQAVALARKLLPPWLFKQYYEAEFSSQSSVFGELSHMWDGTHIKNGMLKTGANNRDDEYIESKGVRFWVSPDKDDFKGEIIHGVDLAKQVDYTVFYSVNMMGKLVGYARYRKVSYKQTAERLRMYLERYYPHVENTIRYDATGVGVSVGESISEQFEDTKIDVVVEPVVFSNSSKSEMVMGLTLAIEQGWHKVPPIVEIEDEYSSYEVSVTKQGNHSFAAPDGEHDDIVSAAMLGASFAFNRSRAVQGDLLLERAMTGAIKGEISKDVLAAYADVAEGENNVDDDIADEEEFFTSYGSESVLDFDERTA